MTGSIMLAAAAVAKDPPLIDLDSTVLIQLALFLITAVVLSRVLLRPYLAMLAAREEGIDGARAEARRMDDAAQSQGADYDAQLAKARARANEERAQIRREANEHEREVSDRARRAAQSAVDGARAKLDADAKTARAELAAKSSELARSIVKKLLGREVA